MNSKRLDTLACTYHPDAILIEDYRAGDLICPECGLVVGDRLVDVGTEWRTFSNEFATDRSRVGAIENPYLAGNDLTTYINNSSGSGSYDEDGKLKYRNVRNPGTDRGLITGFREIANMADRVSLPQTIQDRAHALFQTIHSQKLLKGRSTIAVAAACMYIACRQESAPRTLKEICAISRVSKKDIGRCYKIILPTLSQNMELITTEDFMNRFCANLALDNVVQMAATLIAKRASDLNLVAGRSPVSVAAAAIFLASQASSTKRTYKEIGETAGTAEATIRQSYQLMVVRAAELFPDNFVFSTPINELPY